MGVSREQIRIHIEALVVDGFDKGATELPDHIAASVSAALVERGLSPVIASSTATAVGAQVARSIGG